jgi:hypothetical protein
MKTLNAKNVILVSALLVPNVAAAYGSSISAEFSRIGFDDINNTTPSNSYKSSSTLSKPEIADAQRALNKNGYNVRVDGVVGQKTLDVAKKFGYYDINEDVEYPEKPQFSPLNYNEREVYFGKFSYVSTPSPRNPEGICITDGWASRNIINVEIPQLKTVIGAPKSGIVQFNKICAPELVSLFSAWEDAGLLSRIISWGGSWVPRYIRGSRTILSNHSWGTAFDINVEWNQLGTVPAKVGQRGSVRELVKLANEHGFYWGGHYAKRPDGMHFEFAKFKDHGLSRQDLHVNG